MRQPLLSLILTLSLLACATTGGTRPNRGSNILTAEEIGELVVQTAYEAVERSRPQWLVARGSGSIQNPVPQTPVVYVDGVRMGDVSELRRIWANVVQRMEFLSASDATNRYGTNHTGGAILVTTR
jgi:hypothetical protein